MRDQKRPLEASEVSWIIEGKVRGEIPLSPLDKRSSSCACPSCAAGGGVKGFDFVERMLSIRIR